MSEEKLDLILNVVSHIKNKQESLEKTVDEMKTEQTSLRKTVGEMNIRQTSLEKIVGEMKTGQTSLEKTVSEMNTKLDGLSSDFADFKKQVADSFAAVNKRFSVLEKQMFAIGVELKAEIKREIGAVAARIDRLEKQIIYDRAETLENKDEIREINKRLTEIENNIGL